MSAEALGTGAVGFYFFRTDEEVAVTAQNRDAVLRWEPRFVSDFFDQQHGAAGSLQDSLGLLRFT
ncbi:MAG: hypothetical protein WCE52_19505 [Candidatus Acidiferrum sp.]